MTKAPVSKTLGWLVIIFAVALVGFLYFLILDTNDQLDLASMDGNWMVGVKHKTTTTATTAVPSDWKTYTNTKFNYEFKYSPDFNLYQGVTEGQKADAASDSSNVTVKNGNLFVFSVVEYGKYAGGSLSSAFVKESYSKTTSNPVVNSTETTLNSLKTYKVTVQWGKANNNKEEYFYYIQLADGTVLKLGLDKFTGNGDKIASTFKATDQTAGWKTYTNSQYGFSFKYPTDWYIFQSTRDQRIYISNVQQIRDDQYNKSNMPSNFERVWISYDPSAYTESNMGNPGLYNCTKQAITNSHQAITFYDCPKPSAGSAFAYAYWGDNNRYSAEVMSEILPPKLQDEVSTLKQILSTFQFIK